SLHLRTAVFDAQTTGGRWVNGESDGFPALVLDRYDDTLVLKLYSAIWFNRLNEIISVIRDELSPESLVLRLSRNIVAQAKKNSLEDGSALFGMIPTEPVQFLENGLTLEADLVRG